MGQKAYWNKYVGNLMVTAEFSVGIFWKRKEKQKLLKLSQNIQNIFFKISDLKNKFTNQPY